MNIKASFATLAALVFLGLPASAQGGYSPDQLDQLLQPIALYPDPLLAQLLPAAENPEQIQAAEQYVQYSKGAGVDNQPWDASVRAIAHYPDVLAKMAQDPQWTGAVGEAFATQSQDVTESIQRLRRQAYSYGNLQSSAEMTVTDDQNYLSIAPANPQYIYVPVYDPDEVYYSSYYNRPALYFSAGYSCGPWLNIGLDWIGGSCFTYPRGCYWGPGGHLWGDRGYRGGSFYNATYIHNTYNINNRAAYRGNGGWQGNRGQANFNGGRGFNRGQNFSAANTGNRYQNFNRGNGQNNGGFNRGQNFSAANNGNRYQNFNRGNGQNNGGFNRGQNFSAANNGNRYQNFNRGNSQNNGGFNRGQSFSANNTGRFQGRGAQNNFSTSTGRYSPAASTATPTQSGRYNFNQSAYSRTGGSAFSQPSTQNYSRSYSQPARSFSQPQQGFTPNIYSRPAQQNFNRSFSQPAQQTRSFSQPSFNRSFTQAAQQTRSFSQPSFNRSFSQPTQQNFSRPSFSQPTRSFSQPAQQNFSRPSFSQPTRSFSQPAQQNYSRPSFSQPAQQSRSFSQPSRGNSAPQGHQGRSNRDRR